MLAAIFAPKHTENSSRRVRFTRPFAGTPTRTFTVQLPRIATTSNSRSGLSLVDILPFRGL